VSKVLKKEKEGKFRMHKRLHPTSRGTGEKRLIEEEPRGARKGEARRLHWTKG